MIRKTIFMELLWAAGILFLSMLIVRFSDVLFERRSPLDTSIFLVGDPRQSIWWVSTYLLLIKYAVQGLLQLVRQHMVIAAILLPVAAWHLFVSAVDLTMAIYLLTHIPVNSAGYTKNVFPGVLSLLMVAVLMLVLMVSVKSLNRNIRQFISTRRILSNQN